MPCLQTGCSLKDWLEILALLATAFGLPAAGLSAWIAMRSYRSQIAAGAEAHMHSLFREWLRVRMDNTEDPLPYHVQTFKLYTLEEMYDWVLEQEQDLQTWRRRRPSAAGRRQKELDEWRDTVKSHLRPGAEQSRERVTKHRDCYSDAFVALVVGVADDVAKKKAGKAMEAAAAPPAP